MTMDDTTEKKRRTLGSISVAKFAKMPEWKQFETASQSFTEAKTKLITSMACTRFG
jgi:hypothetical protein